MNPSPNIHPKFFFVFDVESIGLHGEPFAVGWTVVNQWGDEKDSGRLSIFPHQAHGDADDREWVENNIPAIPLSNDNMEAMLSEFWRCWLHWKEQGAVMFAECAWPVESKFLSMCIGVNYPKSKWEGPYPLHDVVSVMLAAGMDPMAKYDRLPNEQPAHEPLADARQSARLLLKALTPRSETEGRDKALLDELERLASETECGVQVCCDNLTDPKKPAWWLEVEGQIVPVHLKEYAGNLRDAIAAFLAHNEKGAGE